MGIFDWLKKPSVTEAKETEKQQEEKKPQAEPENPPAEFVMGVEDTFRLKDSEDLLVAGRIKGTVCKGAAVYICNPGADHDVITVTTIEGIETAPGQEAEKAADCNAGLKVSRGSTIGIRRSSVIFTRNISGKDVHGAYIDALADSYIMKQKLVLSEEELSILSITDLAELWRLFGWFHSQVQKDDTEEARQETRRRIDILASAMCEKILQAEEIYCIYSKATGEPYMFSGTVKQDGGYMCIPPDIRICTKAYAEVTERSLPENVFELRRIENGEKKDGIRNFLGSSFYLNGACGVQVLSEQSSISAEKLVEKPDYSGEQPQNIPVTNPDLERWILLTGQMGKPEGEDAELILRLYYGFLSKEAVKAKFLIPMQLKGDAPVPDAGGRAVFEKDTTLSFATIPGKDGRDAVKMFTDWKRLRMAYDEKWSGMVQQIDGMIDTLDCAINVTGHPQAGCYISKDMFTQMKENAKT